MHTSAFTLFDLLAATEGRLVSGASVPPLDTAIARVTIDSRQVEPGDLFWALPGNKHNGADFIADAWQRGASVAVSSQNVSTVPSGHCLVQINDSLATLWKLAEWKRRQFRGQVVAVTGSIGKSTTREMIQAVLNTSGRCIASPRNYNNHVGLPLSMLGLEPSLNHAVLELGASAPGEIARLAQLCGPAVGVVTGIAEAHLSGFGDLESAARSKLELVDSLPPDGVAVLNGDCRWLRRASIPAGRRVVWFGRRADCDFSATAVNYRSGGLRFRVQGRLFSVSICGRHYLSAALAAVAVGSVLGQPLTQIADALRQFQPLPMRCQVQQFGAYTIINDCYNACPTAMQAALDVLRDFDGPGRRVVISGDMCELGNEAGEYHRQLGEEVVSRCGADLLIACGEHAGEVTQSAMIAGMPRRRVVACDGTADVAPKLGALLEPGDVILIKGSRSMAMENLLSWFEQRGATTDHEKEQLSIARRERVCSLSLITKEPS